MPREVTFAILIGFILGLLITFGVYTANRAIKEQGQEATSENTTIPTPSPTSTTQNTLTISEPNNEELFTQSKVTISGKTSPNAAVAILTESEELFANVDKDGFFSQEIELSGGANVVEIVSTDSFGNQAQAQLILTYSTKVKAPAEDRGEDDE